MENTEAIQSVVNGFTADQLIAKAYEIPSFSTNEMDMMLYRGLFSLRAKVLGCTKEINAIFRAYDKALGQKESPVKAANIYSDGDFQADLTYTKDGKVEPTIINLHYIMEHDEKYRNIHFNLLGNYAEIHREIPGIDGVSTLEISRWSDADEAESRSYIEAAYGVYNERKHNDALRLLFREREYNPVTDYLKSIQWDGVERCEHFLTKWARADDTPYVRECSRLMFAGGIWRMMKPGCKMDDVIVLIGDQGSGKSTLVRFLALNDSYFGEIKTVDGDKAVEQIAGKWICEIPELSAFTKAKEVESIKAFITRQKDSYRKPYDRNVDDRPRMCVMIGTTNNPVFLIDQTGNRRFYPVRTHSNGYDIYRHEEEIRNYIRQCWAEALVKFKQGKMPNYADETLIDEYRKAQDNATQDDWRIGAIEEYLNEKPVGGFVCVKELTDEVISPDREHPQNPTPKDSKDIGIIMNRMKGWEKIPTPRRTAKYGNQRVWLKIAEAEESDEVIDDAESNGLPF